MPKRFCAFTQILASIQAYSLQSFDISPYKTILLKLLIIFLFIVKASATHAQNPCNAKWASIADLASNGTDMANLLTKWKENEQACESNSFYYLQLGWLLLENAKFEEAENAFKAGLVADKSNTIKLKLALADLPFQKATRAFAEVDVDLLNEAEKRLRDFTVEFPEVPDGYASLSGVMLVRKDFESVVQYALKANEFGGNAFALRNLAIAYYELAKDRESTTTASKAIELSETLQGDAELMLTLALAYSNLKEFEYSLGVLRLLVKANPQVQSTSEFQNITLHIREQFVSNQGTDN